MTYILMQKKKEKILGFSPLCKWSQIYICIKDFQSFRVNLLKAWNCASKDQLALITIVFIFYFGKMLKCDTKEHKR